MHITIHVSTDIGHNQEFKIVEKNSRFVVSIFDTLSHLCACVFITRNEDTTQQKNCPSP
jgi:hypothetical protein